MPLSICCGLLRCVAFELVTASVGGCDAELLSARSLRLLASSDVVRSCHSASSLSTGDSATGGNSSDVHWTSTAAVSSGHGGNARWQPAPIGTAFGLRLVTASGPASSGDGSTASWRTMSPSSLAWDASATSSVTRRPSLT